METTDSNRTGLFQPNGPSRKAVRGYQFLPQQDRINEEPGGWEPEAGLRSTSFTLGVTFQVAPDDEGLGTGPTPETDVNSPEELDMADDLRELKSDVDSLKEEVAGVSRRVEEVRQVMETRWSEYKEITTQRLDQFTTTVDQRLQANTGAIRDVTESTRTMLQEFTANTRTLLEGQNASLNRVVGEIVALRDQVDSRMERRREEFKQDLDDQRKELEAKIGDSEKRINSYLTKVITTSISVATLIVIIVQALVIPALSRGGGG